jgi:hypothetical protein
VANVGKTIEAVGQVLHATTSGWLGEAANQPATYTLAVRHNLENFKSELEQWGPVEQPTSAMQKPGELTERVAGKAGDIATAHHRAAEGSAVSRDRGRAQQRLGRPGRATANRGTGRDRRKQPGPGRRTRPETLTGNSP